MHSVVIGVGLYFIMVYVFKQRAIVARNRSLVLAAIALIYMIAFGHGLPGRVNQHTMKSSQSSNQEKYSEFLASVPLLKSLTREEISKICDVLEVRMFNDGEYIIRQGDDGRDFFVIFEGECNVRKSMAPGQPEINIIDLKVGNFFGELALLKDQPRAASVVAKGHCVCLSLDRGALDRGAFERLLRPCQYIMDRAEAAYAGVNQHLL